MVHLRRRDARNKSIASKINSSKGATTDQRETAKTAKLREYFNSSFSYVFGDVKSFESGSEGDHAYTPLNSIAFKLFLISRFCSAMMSNINDCDETYNYWEPLHFISYGSGFQTWEYSPEFALRSYAFLWLYGWVINVTSFLVESRLVMFFVLRLSMAFFCSCFELLLYRASVKVYGASVARLLLIFLAFSPGMFAASVAFLPSSFSMYMCLLSVATVLLHSNFMAVLGVAASVLIAWPFSAIIGVPVAFDIVFVQKRVKMFFIYSITAFFIIMLFMCYVDHLYYQKFVIAPLNIVNYNLFTPHGPDLYGVEPLSYYFKNGLLNMPVAFPLSFLFIPLLIVNILSGNREVVLSYSRKWLPMVGLYIWYAVFFIQPHKEERFLYPVYPLIALSAACTLSLLTSIVSFVFKRGSWFRYLTMVFTFVAMTSHIALGLSRIGSQFVGYHAHVDIYGDFHVWYEQNYFVSNRGKVNVENEAEKKALLCVGREWHRFPSSFFLPDNVRLQFIQSEFKGTFYYSSTAERTFL